MTSVPVPPEVLLGAGLLHHMNQSYLWPVGIYLSYDTDTGTMTMMMMDPADRIESAMTVDEQHALRLQAQAWLGARGRECFQRHHGYTIHHERQEAPK